MVACMDILAEAHIRNAVADRYAFIYTFSSFSPIGVIITVFDLRGLNEHKVLGIFTISRVVAFLAILRVKYITPGAVFCKHIIITRKWKRIFPNFLGLRLHFLICFIRAQINFVQLLLVFRFRQLFVKKYIFIIAEICGAKTILGSFGILNKIAID